MKSNLKKLLIAFVLLFTFIINVKAGSVTATLSGSNNVVLNNQITINVQVSNVVGAADGKIYSLGGFIQYDPEYLEFVSLSGAGAFSPSINNNTHKMALLDMNMSAGASSGTIGTIKFKALKLGSTSVTISSPSATDSVPNSLDVSVVAKNLTIVEPTPKSNNSKLSALGVEGYTITPEFNADTTSYTLTVPSTVDSVNVTATKADNKASIAGAGTATLSEGENTINVVVTAEDGSKTTYTIVITKEAPAPVGSDSTLKVLDVSGYTLSPYFGPGITSYSMWVSNNITGLNVTAIPTDENAKVEISGNNNWVVGNNIIRVVVTATDGSKTEYVVNVNRSNATIKSNNTNIDLRILSTHNINKEYSNSITEYEVKVPYSVTKLDLQITPYDEKATYKVDGNENFDVNVKHPVIITVTAEDGTQRVIKLNVTRLEEEAGTDLEDLQIVCHKHTLNPVFKPSITEYKVNVGKNEKELQFLIKTKAGATAEVIGNENLKEGKNLILIKVTDKNNYVKYYQIEVNKAAKKFNWWLLIVIGLLLLLLLLLFLLFRKRNKEEKKEVKTDAPVNIDIRPEFNFNSKKNTDDDIVYAKGDLYNGMDVQKLPEAKVQDAEYDMYDDVVTKDEIVDALNESIETNNADKLKMLLDQENLNRRKEELKKQEEERNKDIDL